MRPEEIGRLADQGLFYVAVGCALVLGLWLFEKISARLLRHTATGRAVERCIARIWLSLCRVCRWVNTTCLILGWAVFVIGTGWLGQKTYASAICTWSGELCEVSFAASGQQPWSENVDLDQEDSILGHMITQGDLVLQPRPQAKPAAGAKR